MEEAFELTFSNGLTAYAYRVYHLAKLPVALRELGLRRRKGKVSVNKRVAAELMNRLLRHNSFPDTSYLTRA